ncbi:MAG TPA: hypothetical protein VEZ12_06725 [Herpetosiphonaceae bacterium]|jgi:hypothetical protein|nr:hypothetical protein [Herpetosiphonaceae bacterium]
MDTYMVAAGALLLVVAAIHSALGEILMFRHLRSHGLVPTLAAPPLKERHIRILWASWHVLTVLGWAFGAVLLRLAYPSDEHAICTFTEQAIVFAFLAGALLVLVGTKGKHLGWVGLLGVAALTWFASAA